jgi:hypothetical protein
MRAVGEDAKTIERRLVHLMGCSPDEATRLRSVLLRHRALITAAVGAAAALSWVAVVAPGAPAAQIVPPASSLPLSGATSGASYFDVDDLNGVEDESQPVQDVLDGTWSPSYASAKGDAEASQ